MRMDNSSFLSAILAAIAALGLSAPALAQSDSQKKAPPAKQTKPAPKPHKVWTDEEVGSLRTPADAYAEASAKQNAQAGDAQQPDTANQTSTSKQAQKGVPPPTLTNPKSLEEADKMIAWENRDIAAQEEFLDRLKQDIAEAPADQKERLTKLLAQRTQVLANTRNELKNLQTKKRELEKKPAASSVTAAVEPPSQ
jgi:DNA repair exonuclease SbcCD ATPase subunit